MNNIKNDWHIQELEQGEDSFTHLAIESEYRFYDAVRNGNIEYVMENSRQGEFANQAGKGTLSKNALTNVKYHFVITVALITRNCVMAGMVQEQAYRLSDFYINLMDECQSIKDVCALHARMVLDFTTRMRNQAKEKTISKAITQSIEYIYSHINGKISIEEIAEHVHLSPSHFSRLFVKEMGVSASEYIRQKKIERAKNLLQYSDYSFIRISNYLSFSSQSHFINTFEKYVGMTPKKYREQYYRSTWEMKDI